MRETAITFGASQALVGILTEPEAARTAPGLPGVVLINAGLVHRVGPNRLYVKVARHLASTGHPVLRFDLSGIGDSPARTDSLGFQRGAIDETIEAMTALGRRTGADCFVLAGICSGADIAFLTARERPDVVGAVLINGQSLHGVTDSAGDAIADQLKQDRQARYLVKQALFDPKSWTRLFSGGVNYGSLLQTVARQVMGKLRRTDRPPDAAPAFQADIRALRARGVRLLLVYSEGDPGIRYLEIMLGRQHQSLGGGGNCAKVLIPGVDHTFTLLSGQARLLALIQGWLGEAQGWLHPL